MQPPPQQGPARGVVVLAHGSRDPLWRAPIEAVAARMGQLNPGVPVACAYLELCEPGLFAAVAGLIARGVRTVDVVPAFLGVGKHAREDLPRLVEQLKAAHPGGVFTLRRALGEDARLIELMAQIALE